MKTIKKAIALVLTALMVLSLVPAGVLAQPNATPGMTLTEFKDELTPRMTSFYANITPEQATILKAMGDSLNTSTLSPYTTVDSAWTTILGGLVNQTLITKYGSQGAATAVLAKMVYSTMELMFYMDTTAGTDSAKLDAAIENAYNNLYLPMDELAGHAFTQAALSSVLSDVKSTLSSQLSTYASSIMNAMNSTSSADYVDIIANGIASVAVTNLFDTALSGSTLSTLKTYFASNAGFATTDLGSLVGKIYSATASLDSTQKAPSVQFNLLINNVITFQGTTKTTNTIIPFDQAISLDSTSATDNVVYFKINPNRTIAGITVDMTNYFVASSSNESTLTATKQLISGAYYIKLTAHPIVNNETCYVKIYRNSVGGENYYFNIKVDVLGLPTNKTTLATAITDATTLIGSKTVGTDVGNVPQSAKDDYQTAINTATAVNNDANATQATVDAAVLALVGATTTFNNAVILAVPKNVLVKKVGDANFAMTFETIALASAYVKSQADSVKLAPTDKAARYYAVPNDGITPIAGKNVSVSKVIVCDELDANSIIPDGAVVWVSTQAGSVPILGLDDYYTKGVNTFPTIAQAVTAVTVNGEIVIKDGTYAATTIDKKVIIRNGSNPIITGDMILTAAAAGTTIEGVTFGTGVGGALATITVDSPNITIANLDLNNVVLQINAANVVVQNVTAVNPPVGTSVITVNAAGAKISGFSFTEVGAAAGAAITVAPGITGTAITDSVVVDSASTINLNATATTEINIYSAGPATYPKYSNDPIHETNVVLNIRKVASADPTKIKAVVYVTGVNADIDAGHAVIGYTLNTLSVGANAVNAITTASTDYEILGQPSISPGLLEVTFSRKHAVTAGTPTNVMINGVSTPVLDLFDVTFDIPVAAVPGDVYSIWLSQTSPNTKLIRSLHEDVPDGSGDKVWVPYPMDYTVSPSYILDTVPPVPPVVPVTLTVDIQLDYAVKNNLTKDQQKFSVIITNATDPAHPAETYDIYTGANADPNNTHAGATLVARDKLASDPTSKVLTTLPADANAFVSEYTLTLPGYVKGSQYNVEIKGDGYTTVARDVTLNADLLVKVWSGIRSISGANFLAGDIVPFVAGDLEPVNASDLVAIAAQYNKPATTSNMVKYDLNRDQTVDLYDIDYVLTNMKHFRDTY